MEFLHRSYQRGETIAAIATPPGEGGIAIIRISGKESIEIANRIFSGDVGSYRSHTAHFGKIIDLQGNLIDNALLLILRAPHSYTGEDTVELQCHGGTFVSRKVLEVALSAGALPALPGEFTFKAFMNGKLDLTQAEAVGHLIGAKNEKALEMAGRHLEGALSTYIQTYQRELTHLAAILEAWVDFPEEEIEFISRENFVKNLQDVKRKMQQLLHTFYEGRKIGHGIEMCIVGPPNAGKSSLMNSLLAHERAIVSSLPGTTRDLLHEELMLNGLHFHLTDTAGIHHTDQIIEKEGIRRSKEAVKRADLILLVVDVAKEVGKEEKELFESLPKEKTILVWNKMDLPHTLSSKSIFPYETKLSVKKKLGLDELKKTIHKWMWQKGVPSKDEVLITSVRHKNALEEAILGIEEVIVGLQQDLSPELLTADLRGALRHLGRIIGTDVTEDILSSIFSQFCIGK